ncbi:hypothetical protein [Salmonella enterica]|uniref:hypothetical protein n=1 Tax=Salmonella enterica TaxID=28901 RepID=UPI0012C4914A|nr:hypothetical protein [Salmonella enterica]EBU8552021.1 hypothetical protein [Salmonella enterica subsp. enterica serovar Telelkebir]EBY8083616.1 hypothetical protein [Salmonella enterica subsp. enterica serovar Banana]EEE9965863.1 hypothetical protein [Salmonella enterica subsp. enterica serovar Nigeria]EAX8227335.1 hypothetical protein [Salmonella enterica]EEH1523854.1 hypothetical protein [Salmonella enterica subsp. enterica serovar Telelkebir]
MSKQRYFVRWQLQRAIADLTYSLECFGDHLAQEQGYPSGIDGFDAVYLYLCEKHNWTIEQCRSMDKGDIRLALSQEMKGWTLPPEAQVGSLVRNDS